MTETVCDGQVRFAVGGELGPVFGDWRFDVEQFPLGQHARADCDRAFGARHQDRQRIFRVGAIIRDVAARPEIDDDFTVAINAELRAARIVRLGVRKCLTDGFEALLSGAMDGHEMASKYS